jgi:alpha-galactosidase
MRTQINVQERTVRTLVDENVENLYHAAMLDPHTAAEPDRRQIRALLADLPAAQGDLVLTSARMWRAA